MDALKMAEIQDIRQATDTQGFEFDMYLMITKIHFGFGFAFSVEGVHEDSFV